MTRRGSAVQATNGGSKTAPYDDMFEQTKAFPRGEGGSRRLTDEENGVSAAKSAVRTMNGPSERFKSKESS